MRFNFVFSNTVLYCVLLFCSSEFTDFTSLCTCNCAYPCILLSCISTYRPSCLFGCISHKSLINTLSFSSPSVQLFCLNSHFCPIRGKNAGVGHFRKKFREERANRRQLRLVFWLGEGWGYHIKETWRWYLFWFEHSPRVSQTDMPLAKTRYTSVPRVKISFLYSKYVVYH